MNQWLMVAVMAVAFGVWLFAVPFVGRRAARQQEIKAAMKRHPAGKDLDNGR